eukprot:3733269-Heterocapsa_arctica.AAC.1
MWLGRFCKVLEGFGTLLSGLRASSDSGGSRKPQFRTAAGRENHNFRQRRVAKTTTIRFRAECSSFCTKSELETNFELQTHAPNLFLFDAHILLCKTPLSCTPVRVQL